MRVLPMIASLLFSSAVAAAEFTDDVIEIARLQGGLAVVIGCDDARVATDLVERGFVVQALDDDRAAVAEAKRVFSTAGVHGQATAIEFDGECLPYVDNLVNLLVLPNTRSEIPESELDRVLAPRGVLVARSASKATNLEFRQVGGLFVHHKPVPDTIDDWPMHMYEPGNNAVSRDSVVGPPKRLQWRSGPSWTRSHEFASSLNAMVSMDGKLFYVMDEGSRLSPLLPEKWTLICRDGFNGIVLWKRPLPSWHTHWWPVKSGPTQAMRRLVAQDDKLYIPLGVGTPLSELDAATGETIRTFEGTEGIEEIRVSEDTIFLLTSDAVAEQQTYNMSTVEVWNAAGNATGQFKWDDRPRMISAIDRKSGKQQWKQAYPVMTVTLAIDGKRLYFHNGAEVVAINRETGEHVWSSESLELKQYKLGTATAPSLLVHEDVVICGQGFDFDEGIMLALSAETGETLWKEVHQSSGHSSPDDIHIVDGLLWDAGIARIQKMGGVYRGRDLRTGEVKREFPLDVEHNSWFHQRCYRSRATERFLMPSATGIEYVDVRGEHWETNHWVRGACLYGILPANGLTYATPHPCACFMESMVRGFSAFAADSSQTPEEQGMKGDLRFRKGPAYDALTRSDATPETAIFDWPMYRHNAARSGYASTQVKAEAREAWTTDIGNRITPPIAAGGMVFVAAVDQCTIHALDENDGTSQWTFMANGRIDSPPTYYRGRLFFGSADGWLYCLDATDGRLAWRFRAAPNERMLVNDGRVESVWPVHGSVLIENDTIFGLAGRSLFLDGGMYLSLLDPSTGELIATHKWDDIDPETGKSMQLSNEGLKMVPSNSDLLVSDGSYLYLKAQKIGLDGKRVFPDRGNRTLYTIGKSDQMGDDTHLFAPPGFLDTAWHHRSYWLYGRAAGSGWGGWMKPGKYVPAGRILVFDEAKNVFGFGREPAFFAQSHVMEYQLFSAQADAYQDDNWKKLAEHNKSKEVSITNWKQNRAQPIEKMSAVQFNWRTTDTPLLVRAMVGSGDMLFLAGPPDVLDETTLHGRFLQPDVCEQIQEQQDAMDGRLGGIMWAVSAKDGTRLSERKVNVVPVFDGLIAANEQLLMSTTDGKVVCYR
ncbi:MAG: PQQ-binding-like beta-propeller repeat protein [Pirellulaceae bacterium]|nr:PQQ-binding-like beta-propeller repeat protein [Pirellulaceae bacterium]